MQRLRAMTCVGTRRVSYGIAWCRAADLSRLARYRGSALLGAPAARSLQRPGAGVPRPGGGWALSGASRGVGPPRAGEGDGGGWGERRGALPELCPGPVRAPGRRPAGGVLSGLQRLDRGVLL